MGPPPGPRRHPHARHRPWGRRRAAAPAHGLSFCGTLPSDLGAQRDDARPFVPAPQNDYGSEEAKQLGQEVIARESQIGLSQSAQVGRRVPAVACLRTGVRRLAAGSPCPAHAWI